MRAACYGVFGINNHLFMFMSRNNQGGPPAGNWWGNVIMDNADHGTTWNKFTAPGTFNANGVGPCDGVTNADIFEYAVSTYGFNVPVLYAADDGTLGYNTAGNQIDGANAYVYLTLRSDVLTTSLYMMRWPRIAFAAQDNSKVQYWKGPTSPTPADFVSDSNWSLSNSTLTDIHTTATSRQGGRIFFVPTINRYVLLDNVHTANGNTDFYASEAPTPAGPWTQFFTQNNNPQGWIVPAFMHADLIANSSTDNISIRMLYAGDFTNPTYYQPHSSSLVIKTTMPIPSTNTPIQGNGWHAAASSSTPTSLAFTGNITSGNLLVVAWRHASGCAVTAVKDSANGVGVPWTIVYDTSDASSVFGGWAYLFSTVTSVSPPTVSLTLSGTPAGVVMAIEEWNGPQFVRGVSAASTTLTSPALASPLAGDLLIGVCSVNTSTAINAGSSYTIRQTAQNLTSAFFVGIEDNLNAAGGSTTASFTAPGSVDFTSGIGAFYGFAPTFSISGNAGVAGATVSYSGTASGSVTADGSGNYSISNLNAGPYTITPVLNGYSFSPANSAQTIISANITGVNFTGTFVGFTIPSLGGSLNQSLFELYGLTNLL
jgi:hypothetical protein